jgi:hypothetical protein
MGLPSKGIADATIDGWQEMERVKSSRNAHAAIKYRMMMRADFSSS